MACTAWRGNARSAFVATSDSREIFRVDLQGTKMSFVMRIPDATKLGRLAFDEAHQIIYLADVASGRICQYGIATRATSVLLTGLRAPTALSYDPDARRLYIADPGRRAILLFGEGCER
jgi:streptogramin lyase